jgi:hypothetical protein
MWPKNCQKYKKYLWKQKKLSRPDTMHVFYIKIRKHGKNYNFQSLTSFEISSSYKLKPNYVHQDVLNCENIFSMC